MCVCVLVGDHQQLPPHVESDAAKDKGHGISLFQRLFQFVGMPQHCLSIQYRMHPGIRKVSSNLAYGGLLVDGPDVANRKAILGLPWDWTSRFLWLHVDHKERLRFDQSHCNDEEARVIVHILRRIALAVPPPDDRLTFGALSMYNAQVDLMKELWDKCCENESKLRALVLALALFFLGFRSVSFGGISVLRWSLSILHLCRGVCGIQLSK